MCGICDSVPSPKSYDKKSHPKRISMRQMQIYRILLAMYLSNTLSAKIPTHLYDHDYYNVNNMFLTPIEHLHDHNYCIKQDKNTITDYIIDQQYADDIGFISKKKKHHRQSDEKYCYNLRRKKLDYR